MRTMVMGLASWTVVSVLAAGLVAMGGAMGRRRGYEEGLAEGRADRGVAQAPVGAPIAAAHDGGPPLGITLADAASGRGRRSG